MASTTTIAAVLKRYYTDGGVAEQINNESLVTKLFERSTQQWGGSTLHIPVHTGRNSGVGNIPEGGAYPTAGAQVYADLVVDSETLAGRGNITRKMMKKAKKARNPRAAFLSYWDAEVTRIKDDLINLSCKRMVSGGAFKGVVNNHLDAAAATNTGAAQTIANGGADEGDNQYGYFGDFTPFENAVTGTTSTWVRIRLFRMDTYAEIFPTGNPAGSAIYVSGTNTALNQITVSTVAAAAAVDTITDIGAGFGIAVALHTTQLTLTAGADSGSLFGSVVSFANQQNGVFGNLCDPSHFTVARGDVGTLPSPASPADNNILQSNILTQATTGAHAAAPLTAARLQRCLDETFNAGGKEIDCILVNARTRSAYVTAINAAGAAVTTNLQGGKKGDMGYNSLAYAGMPFKLSQHIPLGGYMLLNLGSWSLAELERPSFVDEDGSVLDRVSGVSAFEFEIEWDYNLVCKSPHKNAILCGTAI
jgi:hypothetical protein